MFEWLGLGIAAVLGIGFLLIIVLDKSYIKVASLGMLFSVCYALYFELMRYHIYAVKVIYGISEKRGFVQLIKQFDGYVWGYIIISFGLFMFQFFIVRNILIKKQK